MKANEHSFIVRIDKKAQTERRTVATRMNIGYLGFANDSKREKSKHGGVMVHSIDLQGPMAAAQFDIGDIITHVDEQPYEDYQSLIAYVQSKAPGTVVKIGYVSKLLSTTSANKPFKTVFGSILNSVKHVTLGKKAILLPFKEANPMDYNLQYGVITCIGSQAAALFPEASIGDVLLFSHVVEYKPREEGDHLYNDFHLLLTEESGDELRKVSIDTEVYGVLKMGEPDPAKLIIPYRKYVFCSIARPNSELQTGKHGIYQHKQWEDTIADMALQVHKLQSDLRELSSTTVLHQKTDENNYRIQEEVVDAIRKIQKEKNHISRKMKQKRLVDGTVLYYNPASSEFLGEGLSAGDRIIADRYSFYPLEVFGMHYALANVLAIEAVHREYTPPVYKTPINMKSYPIPGRVLILPDPKMTKTESGLIIPDTAQKYGDTGTVYSVYKQTWWEKLISAIRKREDRNRIFLKKGMRVKFTVFTGRLISVPEEEKEVEVLIMNQEDIDCILD